MDELPDLPDDALEPAELAAAAAPALEQCDASGDVAAVIYANGAPESWDGQAWASAPVWRATVLTPTGGAVVRPDDGTPFAPLTCPDPLLPGLATASPTDRSHSGQSGASRSTPAVSRTAAARPAPSSSIPNAASRIPRITTAPGTPASRARAAIRRRCSSVRYTCVRCIHR